MSSLVRVGVRQPSLGISQYTAIMVSFPILSTVLSTIEVDVKFVLTCKLYRSTFHCHLLKIPYTPSFGQLS